MDPVLARRASSHFREVWWRSHDSWSHGPLCSQKGLKLGNEHIGDQRIGSSEYKCISTTRMLNSRGVKSRCDLNRWIRQ
jgi:hypothetical protein